MPIRVTAYVDGFNLYHAVDNLRDNRLKWLDLMSLTRNFIDPAVHHLDNVFYFSAYADWLRDAKLRHEAYVKALTHQGVTAVMGKFKEKDKQCLKCGAKWKGHEEKETDVNIALYLLDGAYRDHYDQALIISRDSDLAPALRMVKARFPSKKLKLITPPGLRHSKEMAQIVDSKNLAEIKLIHIQRSLLPHEIRDTNGNLVAQRPAKYAKP